MNVLHKGFDSLKFTIQVDIPPKFRETLADAKAYAIKTNAETLLEIDGVMLFVRRKGGSAFSATTGEYGAEWFFLDPQNRAPNNPGVTADFRAFLLATGGLKAAEEHFRTCMKAFGIAYGEHQLRVSRVDFAVDILAPWFTPDRDALVVPPGTRIQEYTMPDETVTHCIGSHVSGLKAGAIANRQLAIYDKRAEVLKSGKLGWQEIWNDTLAKAGKPPLDLNDRDQSQVWRFEMRMGLKQLRNRWEMRSWADLNARVGDAYKEFCERIRYCSPTKDRNRARWPSHELWTCVTDVIAQELHGMRSAVVPEDVKRANRAEHKRMLDTLILGLMVSRAAAEGVDEGGFDDFVRKMLFVLRKASKDHPVTIDERIGKAAGRYRFR